MNRLRFFISWMSTRIKCTTFELYAEQLLVLTHKQYNEFRQEDMIRWSSVPTTAPHFTGHTNGSTASESQMVLNNFKKGTKRNASAFPILQNDLYYDTFQRSFFTTIRAQGFYDVADPVLILMMVISMISNYSLKNNLLCICFGYFSSDRHRKRFGHGV